MNRKRFSKMVETMVRRADLNYIDAIVHLCEENQLEVEDVKKYLTPSIIEKLEGEAMSLNFLEKQNTLDV
jgi:DNA-directed RNA polymerase alpha subunit